MRRKVALSNGHHHVIAPEMWTLAAFPTKVAVDPGATRFHVVRHVNVDSEVIVLVKERLKCLPSLISIVFGSERRRGNKRGSSLHFIIRGKLQELPQMGRIRRFLGRGKVLESIAVGADDTLDSNDFRQESTSVEHTDHAFVDKNPAL